MPSGRETFEHNLAFSLTALDQGMNLPQIGGGDEPEIFAERRAKTTFIYEPRHIVQERPLRADVCRSEQ